MNKKSWLVLGAVAAFLLIIFAGAKASAWTEFKGGESATVPAGETVDGTLWAGARTIDIAGTVDGDVFCGAQTVNISGVVKGDVICGAQTINISGTVDGDIRVGAQTVNLTGSVAGNATIGAQTITTDSKATIGGDASFGATDIFHNGKIGRDLAAGSSNLTIIGEVGRDVKAGVNKITLTNGAKVGGSVEYTSNNAINMAEGAEVAGEVVQQTPPEKKITIPQLFVFGGIMALFAAWLLLVTALILTALMPQFVHRVSNQGINRPWWVLLTGFGASIVVPILAVLLLITVIGLPLGILLMLTWLLITLSSGLFTAYFVGRVIWRSQQNVLLRVLLGSLVLLILFMIPYVGFLFMLVVFWIGAGMLLLDLKDRYQKPKYSLK